MMGEWEFDEEELIIRREDPDGNGEEWCSFIDAPDGDSVERLLFLLNAGEFE